MKKLAIALFVVLLTLGTWAVPKNASAVDVYTTSGQHNVNGREWRTSCAKYSSAVTRCRTEIMATQVTLESGRYVSRNGWVFNNLTYLPSPRAQWAGNPLGMSGEFTEAGRRWRTECDTPQTGRNACRSYIWATYIASEGTSTGWRHYPTSGWLFNNMVRFSSDYWLRISGSGDRVVSLPAGVGVSLIDVTFSPLDEWDWLTVTGLNSRNQEVDYPLIGVENPKASGWFNLEKDVTALEVEADGSWTITVKPISTAPQFTKSASGMGPAVLWYMGSARTATFAHVGESNFIVDQYGDDWKLLVNEIGNYSGQAAMLAGPALIEIDADGQWTIS